MGENKMQGLSVGMHIKYVKLFIVMGLSMPSTVLFMHNFLCLLIAAKRGRSFSLPKNKEKQVA